MTKDPSTFRPALIAFFTELRGDARTAEKDADEAILVLGEAIHHALVELDLFDPVNLPAAEAARKRALAAALAGMPVLVPSAADMAAREETAAAARARRRKEREA
jgi:hypothetical protein